MIQAAQVLLDDLVGAGEQRRGYREPERLCGGEVDAELETGRLLDRMSAGFSPFRMRST